LPMFKRFFDVRIDSASETIDVQTFPRDAQKNALAQNAAS
jgi:hypothetical protein